MAGHLPNLDPESLRRLRRVVKSMHGRNGRSVPMRQLVRLARDVRLGEGVTIDFEASRDLGQPMVVVQVPRRREPAACLARLTPRELEVVALLAEGLGNKQIAARLSLTLGTVKDHVHHVLEKSGLPNRAAVAAAYTDHSGGS